MSEYPAYAVLGSGRWANRIAAILSKENRKVFSFSDSQAHEGESEAAFKLRLCSMLKSSAAQCAWLCDPPGPSIPWMVHGALQAGLHVVVEKPWRYSSQVTRALNEQAAAAKRVVAIHYEYCLLDQLEAWKRSFSPGKNLRFAGTFLLNRADTSGISAMENLGSHLLAMRAYALPESQIVEIRCAYEQPDERRVWIEKSDGTRAEIDFANNREPIIQRFITKFEAAMVGGENPFDLTFAQRVAQDVAVLR